MAAPHCPSCNGPTARQLTEASKIASVNYYMCLLCSHVWTTDKSTGVIVKQLTPLHRTTPPAAK